MILERNKGCIIKELIAPPSQDTSLDSGIKLILNSNIFCTVKQTGRQTKGDIPYL